MDGDWLYCPLLVFLAVGIPALLKWRPWRKREAGPPGR
jgi:hypothetical protein